MESPFHYILLRIFCYPTEAEDKVREALLFVAYGKKAEAANRMEEHTLEGSFGDKIKVMEIKIEKARDIKNFCRNIFSLLDEKRIGRNVDDRCFFNFRFSKEKALEGHIVTAYDNNAISFKGKIKAYPSSRENAMNSIAKAMHEYHNN